MKNWEARLTIEEINNVNDIIGKMKCDPKPTINEFLSTFEYAIEKSLIAKVEVTYG